LQDRRCGGKTQPSPVARLLKLPEKFTGFFTFAFILQR
jgi:hypothetical protein